ELDPEIVEVGRRYFRMGDEEARGILHVYVQDGRYFLSTVPRHYDLVFIDAYRQPYIPFHLTTEEFFAQVRAHLESNGVCAINVGHVVGDDRLVDAIAATMRQVFSTVFVIDLPGQAVTNSIVVATVRPSSLSELDQNTARLEHPVLRHVVAYVREHTREWAGEGVLFTDDRAPVEHVVDQMILNYVQAR
ncbi:MAG: spermidine synthase, partial [Chloroflexia bacterium]